MTFATLLALGLCLLETILDPRLNVIDRFEGTRGERLIKATQYAEEVRFLTVTFCSKLDGPKRRESSWYDAWATSIVGLYQDFGGYRAKQPTLCRFARMILDPIFIQGKECWVTRRFHKLCEIGIQSILLLTPARNDLRRVRPVVGESMAAHIVVDTQKEWPQKTFQAALIDPVKRRLAACQDPQEILAEAKGRTIIVLRWQVTYPQCPFGRSYAILA